MTQMVKHGYAPEWTYEETQKNLFNLPKGIVQDFAILSYLFGARMNEIRKLRPKDIKVITLSDGSTRIIGTIFTEKNPHLTYSDVPMNPNHEPEYGSHLLSWKETFDDQEEIMPLKMRGERYYQRHIRKLLDIHPHALRHLRVHHVDDNTIPGMKPLTPRQFKDFFRWHLIEVSAHYQSRTRSQDLAERM